jgi:hypothetical protein
VVEIAMDQNEDPCQLEREIERAKRLVSGVSDQTTFQRLKDFIKELRQRLQNCLKTFHGRNQGAGP